MPPGKVDWTLKSETYLGVTTLLWQAPSDIYSHQVTTLHIWKKITPYINYIPIEKRIIELENLHFSNHHVTVSSGQGDHWMPQHYMNGSWDEESQIAPKCHPTGQRKMPLQWRDPADITLTKGSSPTSAVMGQIDLCVSQGALTGMQPPYILSVPQILTGI